MKNKLIFSYFLLLFSVGISALSSQNSTIIDDAITNLLKKKRNFNKMYGYGYKIQIYNGNEIEARKKYARFKIKFPEIETKLLFDTPEWKVQVGMYKTKLEADRATLIFKKKFDGIIVIPLGK